MSKVNYKDAGVNIDAGNDAVNRIKENVKSTFTKNVLTGIGSFGSLFSLKTILKEYDNPVLVQSIDGVGTKTIIARAQFLIEYITTAERVQILTFTRKSASEIVERVKNKLGDKANNLKASTFHTWCMSLIRKSPDLFGCRGFSVIDRDDQLTLLRLARSSSDKLSLIHI